MKGGIYTDQRCIVCGAKMRDTGRDVSCLKHPQVKATRFRVKFGSVVKRFKPSTIHGIIGFEHCLSPSCHSLIPKRERF